MASASGIRTAFDASTGIGEVVLARPRAANALRPRDLYDLRDAMRAFERMNFASPPRAGAPAGAEAREVKCVVLSAEGGRHFCAGLDLAEAAAVFGIRSDAPADGLACEGAEREQLYHRIRELQDCVTSIASASFPVIACVTGACYGLGVDIIAAADIVVADATVRPATRTRPPDGRLVYARHTVHASPADHDARNARTGPRGRVQARFCVKEVDMAITADLGSLQRLPPIIGLNNARDLALSCRVIDAEEAMRMGLVSSVSSGPAALRAKADALAAAVAAKPTLALRGTKRILNDMHSVDVGRSLDMNAMNNAALMVSEQLRRKLRARL